MSNLYQRCPEAEKIYLFSLLNLAPIDYFGDLTNSTYYGYPLKQVLELVQPEVRLAFADKAIKANYEYPVVRVVAARHHFSFENSKTFGYWNQDDKVVYSQPPDFVYNYTLVFADWSSTQVKVVLTNEQVFALVNDFTSFMRGRGFENSGYSPEMLQGLYENFKQSKIVPQPKSQLVLSPYDIEIENVYVNGVLQVEKGK